MLLDLKFDKEVFFDYWDIRVELFKAAGVKYGLKKSLTDIHVDRSQIKATAKFVGKGVWSSLGPWIRRKEEELKAYRAGSRNGDANSKIMIERNKKLFLVSKTSAAPLAFRMVQFYMAKDVVEKGRDHTAAKIQEIKAQKEAEEAPKILNTENKSNEKVIKKTKAVKKTYDSDDSFNYCDDTPPLSPRSSVAESSEIKQNKTMTGKATTANDWEERDKIMKRILEIEKKSREKRNAMCLLISLTRSIDSLIKEAYGKLTVQRTSLNKFSKLVSNKKQKGELYKSREEKIFFLEYSRIFQTNYKSMCKRIEVVFYKGASQLNQRARICYPWFKGYRDLALKSIDMNISLFKGNKGVSGTYQEEIDEDKQKREQEQKKLDVIAIDNEEIDEDQSEDGRFIIQGDSDDSYKLDSSDDEDSEVKVVVRSKTPPKQTLKTIEVVAQPQKIEEKKDKAILGQIIEKVEDKTGVQIDIDDSGIPQDDPYLNLGGKALLEQEESDKKQEIAL